MVDTFPKALVRYM